MSTMRDVAIRAGVSIATVSFTVNQTKRVSPKTRARVEQAMQELGYRRNAVARALASKSTKIIALLYPALQHHFSGTAVNFFTSAAQTASDLGYNLVLWPISNDAEQIANLVAGGLVDGVLLMEVQMDDPRVDALVESGTPFALIGRTRDPSALPFVDVDFEGTVAFAIQHLYDLGHRNICLLDGSVGSKALSGYGPTVRTKTSYQREMLERGLTPISISCDETPTAGRLAAGELLTVAPETTAVLVLNEHAAFGLVSGLTQRGIHIPTDMSIISVGSSADMAAMSDPQLTLLASPSVELGRLGVEALLAKIEGRAEADPHILIMCSFKDGETTGPAPR